jgi:PAS domain S-box-containing protein
VGDPRVACVSLLFAFVVWGGPGGFWAVGQILLAGLIGACLCSIRQHSRSNRTVGPIREALQGSPVALVELDEFGRVRVANPVFERLCGRSSKELVGRALSELAAPNASERIAGMLGELAQSGSAELDLELPGPGGALLLCRLAASRWIDGAGRPAGALVCVQDVTELRRLERNLQSSEQRFRELADSAPFMIWTSTIDASVDWFNQRWLTFTGRSLAQERDMGWEQSVHPEDRERCLATYLQHFYARQPFSMEYRLRRHDSQHRRILDQGAPRFGAAGEFLGFVGSCVEVEEQRQQESARQAAQRRLEALLDNLHGGYLRVRAEGSPRVLSASRRVALLSGYGAGEFERGELTWADLVHPEDRARRAAALESEGAFWVEYRLCDAHGERRWIREQGRRLLDENCQPVIDSVVLDISAERHAAALLADSDARLSGLLQENRDVIAWEWDPAARRFLYLSPSAEDWGYPREAWDREDFIPSVVHPEDLASVQTALAEVARDGVERRLHNRVRTADGRELWLAKRISRRVGEDGQARVIGFCQDVTAEKQREAQLLAARQQADEERERLDLALDSGGLGMWDLRWSEDRLLCDGRSAAMLGLTEAQRSSDIETWRRRVHPDDRGLNERAVAEHAAGKTPHYEALLRLKHKDGRFRAVMCRGRIIERDAQGQPLRMVGTHCDVSDHEAREQAMRAQAEILRLVVETIPYRIFWKDRKSRYLGCNRAFARLAGFEQPAQIVGLRDQDLPWTRVETEAYRNEDTLVMLTGQPRLHQVESQTLSDGSQTWIDSSKVPLIDPQGQPFGVLGITSDITAQRQREQELARLRDLAEAASRAKSEFLANMSHEIRTPLTAIMGYAELLLDDLQLAADAEGRQRTLETIRTAGQHLLTVIDDILDLSKIEAGRMDCEQVEFALPDCIAGILALLEPRARAKGIRLELELETALPARIRADPTRIRQVLLNLVGNAVKFTSLGSVRVRAALLGGERPTLRFDVEDRGPGIAPDRVERLFESFAQADGSTTRRFGGTGLGLAISRRLARLMGGDVELCSSEPGRGCLFRFQVPVEVLAGFEAVSRLGAPEQRSSPADPAAALPAAKAPAPLVGLRALLAEDGPENQRLIAHHLRRLGATVATAGDGLQALEALRAAAAGPEPFDLLVTDVQMPELDGLALVRRLRAEGCALPVVALTAHAMSEDERACLDAGCDAYATKPLRLDSFRAALSRALEQRDPGRQRTA